MEKRQVDGANKLLGSEILYNPALRDARGYILRSNQPVFPKTLDSENLIEKFDVLIFVSGAIPAGDREVHHQPDPARF